MGRHASPHSPGQDHAQHQDCGHGCVERSYERMLGIDRVGNPDIQRGKREKKQPHDGRMVPYPSDGPLYMAELVRSLGGFATAEQLSNCRKHKRWDKT